MFLHHLKVTLRNCLADGMYTFIILFGLSIGIASSLVIVQYLHFELTFDRHQEDRDRVYFAYMKFITPAGEFQPHCHPAIAPLIAREVPHVEMVGRIAAIGLAKGSEFIVECKRSNDSIYYSREKNLYAADPSILKLLTIRLVSGDTGQALKRPHTVLIAQKLAKKLFGKEKALGRKIRLNVAGDMKEYEVTAIVEDPPPNTSLQYSAIFSFEDPRSLEEIWTEPGFRTFIKISPGYDSREIEKAINTAALPFLQDIETKYKLKESIHLYPLTEFHFYNSGNPGTTGIRFTGDRRVIHYLIILATLILVVSWANYINLISAKSLKRFREVALRRVSGANRQDLLFQFIVEHFFINAFSLSVALTLAQLLFPLFTMLVGSNAYWTIWSSPLFWMGLLVFLVFSTVVSGIYPTIFLSRYNTLGLTRPNYNASSVGIMIRKALLVLQFTFCLLLMMTIYVIVKQVSFMRQKELSSIDQIIVVRVNDLAPHIDRRSAFEKWKQRIKKLGQVKATVACYKFPGENTPSPQNFYRASDPGKRQKILSANIVSENYFSIQGLRIIAGRDFTDDRTDQNSIIIHSQTAHELGFQDPAHAIGEKLILNRNEISTEQSYSIIGVVEDFSYSVKALMPIGEVFFFTSWNNNLQYYHFLVSVKPGELDEVAGKLENEWKLLFNNSPFDYFVLREYFSGLYQQEMQLIGLIGFFSVVSVVISCMGIFGLSMLSAEIRTKEIGIRKSIGASSSGLIWLLSRDYIKLICAASILGFPLGYFLLTNWLEAYTDTITIEIDAFLVPLLVMLLMGAITIGHQIVRTAFVNPARLLRYE